MAEQSGDDLLSGRGGDVAATMTAWANLPAAHLKVALDFWSGQLKLDHEHRAMREKNQNRLNVMGMISGIVLSVASIGSAIGFGIVHDYWMAGIMVSPSVFATLKLFVTRKSDKMDVRAAGAALGAVTQPGGPQPL